MTNSPEFDRPRRVSRILVAFALLVGLVTLPDRTDPPARAAASDLDPGFDSDGMATFDIGSSGELVADTLLQADGKVVIVGTVTTGTSKDFLLVRNNADGTPDTGFGTNGVVTTDFGYQFNMAAAAALDSSGRILVTGSSITYLGFGIVVARYLANGSIDTSFGTNGWRRVNFGASETVTSMAVQSDGRIVIAGKTNSGSGDNMLVTRLTSDGTVDTSFNGSGLLTFDLGNGDDSASAVTIDATDRIIVAGMGGVNNDESIVLRLNTNGTPDMSFLVTGAPGDLRSVGAVLVDGSGRIVVAGGNGNDLVILRYTTSGTLDTSFDSDGMVVTAVATEYGSIADAAFDSSGRIVVTGENGGVTNYEVVVARYNTDGSLDTSFSSDGIYLGDEDGREDFGASVLVVAGSTRILVASQASTGYNHGISVFQLDSTGAVDTGHHPMAGTEDIGAGAAEVVDTAIQPDGRIVMAGRAFDGTQWSTIVMRLLPGGQPDSSFGTDGVYIAKMGSTDSAATELALQPDGKIVVSVFAYVNGNADIALVRLNSDGTPDSSFDVDGFMSFDVAGGFDIAQSVALQSDGKIVVAGYSGTTGAHDFLVARFNANGTIDTGFNATGYRVTDLGGTSDTASSMLIQPDGRIVVAGKSNAGACCSMVVTRLLANGGVDTTFDSDGRQTLSIAGRTLSNTALERQPDGRILVMGEALIQSDNRLRTLVARLTGDGALDSTFDVDGYSEFDLSPFDESAQDLIVQADGRIIMIGSAQTGSITGPADVMTARILANGVLDATYGVNGVEVRDAGGFDDSARAGALQGDGRLVVVGKTSTRILAMRLQNTARVSLQTVTPVRIMDTRDGTGGVPRNPVGNGINDQGAILTFDVLGKGGLPSTANQIGAVSLNVTATNTNSATGSGYVSVFPCGTNPNVSNLNFTGRQSVPNAVITPISNTGTICFKVYGSTDLIVDVNGWYPPGTSFRTVTPVRIMDTRDGTGGVPRNPVGNGINDQGAILTFDVLGTGGLPATANQIGAVSLNVTATNTNSATGSGYVSVFPCGTNPNVSNLNFTGRQSVPNAVITPISNTGTICFKVYGSTDLIVDVNGWYPPGTSFRTVTPVRIMDTRDGTGGVPRNPVGNGINDQGAILTFDVLGKGGLPATANQIGAVSLNVTATNTNSATGSGYVSVFPCGTNPNVSNLNFTGRQSVPNAVITPISNTGTICFKVYGSTDLIVDVNGWFSPD